MATSTILLIEDYNNKLGGKFDRKFKGRIPATVTPFNKKVEIDFDDLKEYMKWTSKANMVGSQLTSTREKVYIFTQKKGKPGRSRS